MSIGCEVQRCQCAYPVPVSVSIETKQVETTKPPAGREPFSFQGHVASPKKPRNHVLPIESQITPVHRRTGSMYARGSCFGRPRIYINESSSLKVALRGRPPELEAALRNGGALLLKRTRVRIEKEMSEQRKVHATPLLTGRSGATRCPLKDATRPGTLNCMEMR